MAVNMLVDGTVRASFVTSIASKAAPTTTELNAGISLEAIATPDGLDVPGSTASIDLSSLASTFSTSGVGRRSFGPINLILKRQNQLAASDPARATLVYQAIGFLVVRRGIAVATAWTTGQEVEVYPVQVGQPMPVKPAANSLHTYTVPLYVTDDAVPIASIA